MIDEDKIIKIIKSLLITNKMEVFEEFDDFDMLSKYFQCHLFERLNINVKKNQ